MTNELGDFLRARREAVKPDDVGLPSGGRRQTPGLRRSELATLAGISVEYLTRLEQGRDARPSTQVLGALAQALRLTAADRDHLQQLATISQGTELCAHARQRAAQTVRPTVRAILDQLHPAPAVVVNHLTDLLAWNDAYDRLARPLGLLDLGRGHETPNVLNFLVGDPRARDAYPDWSAVLDEQIAFLHTNRRGDPAVDALAEHLTVTGGETFAARWRLRPLTSGQTGLHSIDHPAVGPLRLTFESLDLADRDPQRLITYLPADSAASAALDRLVGRQPRNLRSTTGR
ncbi:helix-turn-helix transcriptional regulator [Mumia quercus]|uniref:helix-turn-helix transcriptional regulator n=1 Tax=Mumia quercus TaxID=2976125 RepID=UPI0021D3C5CD|nr:helix-turn-helix transcriptional regulator [Mumia quercus]